MTVWTTPATWATGAVTAAQMNTEIRDHLNWLKGALDVITESTATDTGTTTKLVITRAAGTDNVLEAKVTGDSWGRLIINADGKVDMSHGADTIRTMFQYHSNNYLSIEVPMVQQFPMRLWTKSGAIVDGDVPAYFGGSLAGMIALDTLYNSGKGRLMVKVGANWRYVALV